MSSKTMSFSCGLRVSSGIARRPGVVLRRVETDGEQRVDVVSDVLERGRRVLAGAGAGPGLPLDGDDVGLEVRGDGDRSHGATLGVPGPNRQALRQGIARGRQGCAGRGQGLPTQRARTTLQRCMYMKRLPGVGGSGGIDSAVVAASTDTGWNSSTCGASSATRVSA